MKVMTALLMVLVAVSGAIAATKLDDYQVYSIRVNHPFEPSGLTLKEGQLYTVGDDSSTIYTLQVIDDKTATAVPHLKLNDSDILASELDFEGVTVAGDEFFVVSEVHHKMIRFQPDHSYWVPESGGVYESAFAFGLFQIYNAGMEAIAYLGDQTFLLSVERQPRGLIEVKFDQGYKHIISQNNQMFDDSKFPVDSKRKPDLTGLYYFDGVLYALHRNAYLIHELAKDQDGIYREGRAWSFEHIVKDPAYAYQDMRFGQAEGLAVDEQYFYLVIDNNNKPKLLNPNDNTPLLIKAKRH